MTEKVDEKTPKRKKAESSYNPMILGDILEREMGDMTRSAFSKKLGITRTSLNKYLSAVKGGVAPSCEALCLMADNLGCSVDYLLGRTEARVPEKAVAVDELGLSEKAVASLLKYRRRPKELDMLTYRLFSIIIATDWFWNLMEASLALLLVKAKSTSTSEKSSYPIGFSFETINGRNVVCYSGETARESIVHYISGAFVRGLEDVISEIVHPENDSYTIDFDSVIYGRKRRHGKTEAAKAKRHNDL